MIAADGFDSVSENFISHQDFGFIDAVAAWCQATQGGISPTLGLRKVCDAFGAELGLIARVEHDDAGSQGSARKVRVVVFDRRANFVNDVDGFRLSVAEIACGRYLSVAKPGSVWPCSVSDFEGTPRVAAPLVQRRLSNTLVIVLERNANHSDFLELHFPKGVVDAAADKVQLVSSTLSNAWKARSMGLFSNNVLRDGLSTRTGEGKANMDVDILAINNPCKLSRAEYRICVLLNAGLNKQALLEELSISATTLRTHLRSIYAKTDTASQSELLQRLLVFARSRSANLPDTRYRVA